MPRILVLSFSDHARDPRVARQIGWLADAGHSVAAAGFAPPTRADVRFIRVTVDYSGSRFARGARLLLGRNDAAYWSVHESAYHAVRAERYDLIVANDLDALPLASRLGDTMRTPVVFDAHEYSPREFEQSQKWRLLRGRYAVDLCRRYVPRCSAVTTVGPGVAEAFRSLTGVTPTVITNAPPHHADLKPTPVDADRIRLVHHGIAIPARKIESMVRVAELLEPRFETHFILMDGVRAYRERIESSASARVHFHPPVSMPDLSGHLNQFDIGLFLLEPTNFNYLHALPNKFFEFVQARLAIAVGPSPDMADLVRRHSLGVVAADFEPATLAAAINRLSPDDIARFKHASHAAAEELSADRNREAFLAICRGLLPT